MVAFAKSKLSLRVYWACWKDLGRIISLASPLLTREHTRSLSAELLTKSSRTTSLSKSTSITLAEVSSSYGSVRGRTERTSYIPSSAEALCTLATYSSTKSKPRQVYHFFVGRNSDLLRASSRRYRPAASAGTSMKLVVSWACDST
jgi:hypothetical protein